MKNSSLISKILIAAVTLGILTYFGVQILSLIHISEPTRP